MMRIILDPASMETASLCKIILESFSINTRGTVLIFATGAGP
jgi:hypothetical protein